MQPADDETEETLPSTQALVAGAVTLMTTWAVHDDAACGDAAGHRAQLARQIAATLHYLQAHPCVSAPLRQVICRAHRAWLEMAQADDALAQADEASLRTVWH